jgi:hypothetical protein
MELRAFCILNFIYNPGTPCGELPSSTMERRIDHSRSNELRGDLLENRREPLNSQLSLQMTGSQIISDKPT